MLADYDRTFDEGHLCVKFCIKDKNQFVIYYIFEKLRLKHFILTNGLALKKTKGRKY